MSRWGLALWGGIMRFAVVALLAPLAAQAAPMTIGHSARLVDSVGVPLQGTQTLHVRLFSQESGGSSVWTNTYTPTAEDGYVQVTLSGGTPTLDTSIFNSAQVWLELELGSAGPLSPRTQLASVPYAMQSDLADHVRLDTGTATEPCDDGALHLDTATSVLSVCNAAAWVEVSSGGTLGTAGDPGLDCQQILNDDPTAADGTFWIDPDGGAGSAAYEVWCDMEAGTGWVLSYVMCQDSTGSIQAMDRATPIVPGAEANPSALSYSAVSALNPGKIRFTSDHTGGAGYIFSWSTISAGNNFAEVLFDGLTRNLNTCNTLGVPMSGSTGPGCTMSIEHNNNGSESHDIPSLGCGCSVWAPGGMMWGQIDALPNWNGTSHLLTHNSGMGSSDSPDTTTGCVEIYVQ